ncbi:MAG: tetratricopeptide repeat protein [Chloroflexota bacterium]
MSEHELWNELGNLYYLSGAYDQAVFAYNRSIQMESRFGRPYSNLALVYVRMGKYAEAVRLYQAGIELLLDGKEKAISWYRLGDVYRCAKNYRDAILAYQQGDLLDPTLGQDDRKLGEVLYGASGLDSASNLPLALTDAQPAASASASDSAEAGAAIPEAIGPPPAPTVEPEPLELTDAQPTASASASDSVEAGVAIPEAAAPAPTVAPEAPIAEEVAPGEGPEANIGAGSSVPRQEGQESALAPEESPAAKFEGESYSVPFERESARQLEKEEAGDWLFYFGSEAPSREAASEPIALVPILTPAPLALQPGGFSPRLIGETQLDTIVRVDFLNVAVAQPEESLSLTPATPPTKDQDVPDAQEATVLQNVGAAEDLAVEQSVELEEAAAALEEAQAPQAVTEAVETPCAVDSGQEAFADPSTTASNETDLEIARIKRELEADPRNATAWQTLGDLQKSARKYEDAIYAYQQAVSNDPKNVEHLHRLGMGYAIEGRVEEAVKTFQEILALNSNYGLVHATLSGYYRRMGFEDLATKHMNIAQKRINDSESEYNRACLQALCGNADEALALLKIALETKQTFADWALRDPDLEDIRSDPRFERLLSDFR